jgi:hypothetical protein
VANLAPYFFIRLFQPELSPSAIELDSWGEFGGSEEAEAWWSTTSREQWVEQLRPFNFLELLESERVGLLHIPRAEWDELIADVPNAQDDSSDPYGVFSDHPLSDSWIEARELASGSMLVYPNDSYDTTQLSFFSLIRDSAVSVVVVSIVFFLQSNGGFRQAGTDGDRPCKFKIEWGSGVRRVECARATCAEECKPLKRTSKGDNPIVDCAC